MSGTSSGTFLYNPPISELSIEVFERCGKATTELTTAQIASIRRSINLVLVTFANRGVNLWTVAEFKSYMPQGVNQYFVPQQVIDVLADSVVLRQYMMGAPTSVAPQFTTNAGITSVTVTGLSVTPGAGQFIAVNIPISVGGIIIQAGFYQVTSVPGSGMADFTVPVAPPATVVNGGAVPQFASTLLSPIITVTFANHGLMVGQSFVVQQTTSVAGVLLLGPYQVTSVVSSSAFTITAPNPAGAVVTVSENGGLASLSSQTNAGSLIQPAFPVDITLSPLSRGEWMDIPNKKQQGRPTSFWVDRQIIPVMHIWPVPAASGPYQLVYRASQQIQDADITNGQVLNVPYRFYEAFVSALTAAMAQKLAPAMATSLASYAALCFQESADEDRERVSSYLTPDFSSYFH